MVKLMARACVGCGLVEVPSRSLDDSFLREKSASGDWERRGPLSYLCDLCAIRVDILAAIEDC